MKIKLLITGLLLLTLIFLSYQYVNNYLTLSDALCNLNITLPSSSIVSKNNNTLILNIDGYYKTCNPGLTLYNHPDNKWEKATTNLPGKGAYYLDNQFVEHRMGCDLHHCNNRLPNQLKIYLTEYQIIGEQAPPEESEGNYTGLVPVFQSVPLKGRVKIHYEYYQDNNCQNEITLCKIINI